MYVVSARGDPGRLLRARCVEELRKDSAPEVSVGPVERGAFRNQRKVRLPHSVSPVVIPTSPVSACLRQGFSRYSRRCRSYPRRESAPRGCLFAASGPLLGLPHRRAMFASQRPAPFFWDIRRGCRL